MKIAIHPREGSYSGRWLEYCKTHKIPVRLVDCTRPDIVEQLADCDGLMWHWVFHDRQAMLFAKQLTASLEAAGKIVFPDSKTSWHYDDKVGQKYLLEAIGAPLIPSYVFYDKDEALEWCDRACFPKVFKLRTGAGSTNVLLARTRSAAIRMVRKAFSRGFSATNRKALFNDAVALFHRSPSFAASKHVTKSAVRCLIPERDERRICRERDYAYFQDFLPGNSFDTRLTVIGNRCFGLRRYVRRGDFRASGSGLIEYGPDLFDPESIKIAFDISDRIGSQSLAFDFLLDESGQPKIAEISYCFVSAALEACPGYWDQELNWHEGATKPEYCMIEDFVDAIEKSRDVIYRVTMS